MRIALIGAGGQLGTALTGRLTGEIIPLGRDALDIADASSVAAVLTELQPDLVINAAAYNFVDRAEDERDRATAVNALGPKHLAQVCAGLDLPLVHVSTEHVFAQDTGRRVPYT